MENLLTCLVFNKIHFQYLFSSVTFFVGSNLSSSYHHIIFLSVTNLEILMILRRSKYV